MVVAGFARAEALISNVCSEAFLVDSADVILAKGLRRCGFAGHECRSDHCAEAS